ncbi:hypothetical protein ACLOJK_036432 [Asimina triloba]
MAQFLWLEPMAPIQARIDSKAAPIIFFQDIILPLIHSPAICFNYGNDRLLDHAIHAVHRVRKVEPILKLSRPHATVARDPSLAASRDGTAGRLPCLPQPPPLSTTSHHPPSC